ncbi:MAG: sortase [Candidatus Saccharimonadales bacterium]
MDRLRVVNNYLTVAVIAIALYIIAAPFLPQVGWWLGHESPVKNLVHSPAANPDDLPPAQQQVAGDRLFIPRLAMQEAIYGGGIGALSSGVWRVPHTSTPDKGGNTVLVGHRFTYKDPTGVFYHLDKVERGDRVTVHWQGKVYQYQVADIRVVPATELSVEAGTPEPQLTLYTCTPVWSVENRLVIVAKLLEEAV